MMKRDPIYVILGANVREWRKLRHFTQEELAHEVGTTRTSICNIETGVQRPPLAFIFKIARVLNCKVSELIPTENEVTF